MQHISFSQSYKNIPLVQAYSCAIGKQSPPKHMFSSRSSTGLIFHPKHGIKESNNSISGVHVRLKLTFGWLSTFPYGLSMQLLTMQVIVCYSDMARKSELAFCRFLLAEQEVEWGFPLEGAVLRGTSSFWVFLCETYQKILRSCGLSPTNNGWCFFCMYLGCFPGNVFLSVEKQVNGKKGNCFNCRPRKTNVIIRCRCFNNCIGAPVLPMIGSKHSKLVKWRNVGDAGSFFSACFSLPFYTIKGKSK